MRWAWVMVAAGPLVCGGPAAAATAKATGARTVAVVVFVRDSTGSYRSPDDSPALAAMLDSVRAEVRRRFTTVRQVPRPHHGEILSIAMGYAARPARPLNGRLHVKLGANQDGAASWCPGASGPALVLQLTGERIGADGRVQRTATEGIAVRDWPRSTFVGNANDRPCGYVSDAEDEQGLAALLAPVGRVAAWRVAARALLDSLTAHPH